MARPGPEPLVRCEALSIAYAAVDGRQVRVVRDVSFTLDAGESLGIVGESGSGKSTLARALLGYRRAGARFVGGSLRIGGRDVTAADRPTLGRLRGLEVAMVPQNPLAALTYHKPVGGQVEEVLVTRKGLGRRAAAARTRELFAEMGLPDPAATARRYPHQLSGGQRQRVVIAAALACDPRLLVLDEPTTALDKTTEAQVLDLVLTLKARRGSGLVLVTHDLNVVAKVCDRVLVMKDGAVVEHGPVRRVFALPQTDYARTLLAASLDLGTGLPPPPPPPDGALLAGERLAFRYGAPGFLPFARRAAPPFTLRDVDLRLGRGEVLGIIGESGSGKTTLGLLIAGLVAPSAGELVFEGRSIARPAARRSPDLRRRIQIVFQDPLSSLNPRHTVGAAVTRPMRMFLGLSARDAQRRAEALLAELGLGPEYLARYPRQLSGGQQQRVAIARAFAAEPDVLVCDEITSALDASVQSQVLDLLSAMQRRNGTSLIVISHDLAVIWKMASRVAVLKGGCVIEAGATAAMFGAPASDYTRDLLTAATRATRVAQAAPPSPGVRSHQPREDALAD